MMSRVTVKSRRLTTGAVVACRLCLRSTRSMKTSVESRLRSPPPQCATHDVYLPVFIVEQNLVEIDEIVVA